MPFLTQNINIWVLWVTGQITKNKVFYIKGAPEIILDRCTQILTTTELKPLTKPTEIAAKLLQDYQRGGTRCLGFAYHETHQTKDLIN